MLISGSFTSLNPLYKTSCWLDKCTLTGNTFRFVSSSYWNSNFIYIKSQIWSRIERWNIRLLRHLEQVRG